jgi:ABC-type nitrate/sulfonate/bicarbonate transport system permease component
VVVVLVCFFPITISLLEGLASVDQELLDLLRAMGANKIQIYRIVKLPSVLPNFFSGLKIAGTYSVMGAIIGEWVGGKKGLGVYMLRVRHSFATDKVFATIIVITLLSIIMLKGIHRIEKKSMPWMQYLNKDVEEEK